MTAARNPIYTDLDFAAEGKQLGYLRLPHSVHRSAYGWIPIPAGCLKNGQGPKVVLMAGNHGDEYEGQVLLSSFLRRFEPQDISGTLIILPMANTPAALAGLRTSPLDQGNLNRSFTREPTRGPTSAIADYLERTLFADVDLLIDLHSGGSSLVYVPSAIVSWPEDPAKRALMQRLLEALAMPTSQIFPPDREGPFSSSAAQRNGGLAISTEIAGGGTVTPAALKLAEGAVLRALATIGVYRGSVPPAEQPTRFMTVEAEHYVYAMDEGLFEPLAVLGDKVRKGDPAALIHRPEIPGAEPIAVTFPSDGEVVCLRVPARVVRGDCLFHLARPDQA